MGTHASPSSESEFLRLLVALLEAPFTVMEGLLSIVAFASFVEVSACEFRAAPASVEVGSSSEESPPASARSSASRSAILVISHGVVCVDRVLEASFVM